MKKPVVKISSDSCTMRCISVTCSNEDLQRFMTVCLLFSAGLLDKSRITDGIYSSRRKDAITTMEFLFEEAGLSDFYKSMMEAMLND